MSNPAITLDELCEKLGKPKGYFDSILREDYLARHKGPLTHVQVAGFYRRGAIDALQGSVMDTTGCDHYKKGYEDTYRDFCCSLQLYMQDQDIPFSVMRYLENL